MNEMPKKDVWKRSWVFPASLLLHVLVVGAIYMQWPQMGKATDEPESVNVELVEEPKPEPADAQKKAEEAPPPPAAEPKPQEPVPPPPPPPETTSALNAAIRPQARQAEDMAEAADEPDAAGQAEKTPDDGDQAQTRDQPKDAVREPTQPPPEAPEAADPPTEPAANQPAQAPDGELLATDRPEEAASAPSKAVPMPKPAAEEKPAASEKAGSSGDPDLKPARKILATAKPPGPMMRQIFGNLPPGERVQQLCQAEIFQQIAENRKGQAPLEGVMYAKKAVEGSRMDANGAFNAGADWFPLAFRCTVDIDRYIVTDFQYDIRPKMAPEEAQRRGYRAQ